MAARAGSSQTVVDGLKSVFTDTAGLMMLPDSAQHMQFLTGLMATIQKYVLAQGMAAINQPMPGGPPGAPPGGPPGAGLPPPGGPPAPSGAGNPMRAPTPAPGQADQLAAMMAGAG